MSSQSEGDQYATGKEQRQLLMAPAEVTIQVKVETTLSCGCVRCDESKVSAIKNDAAQELGTLEP